MDGVSLTRNGSVAILTLDNPPVNAMSTRVRMAFMAALNEVVKDADVTAIVIAAAGKLFTGGADITEFDKPPQMPSLPDMIDAIETCSKPVVVAVNGVAFGGGLELSLGCHGRVAASVASVALPEVKLGLLPGAGGTQRLPRLIDPVAAFEIMLSGDPVKADKALALGIVDAVVDLSDLPATAIAHAQKLAASGHWPRVRDLTADPARRDTFEAAAAEAEKKVGHLSNTEALIDAVRSTFTDVFDAGILREREHFLRLVLGEQSKALRYVFFSERETGKVPGVTKNTPVRDIKTAAVIGAGTMGGGISMCFANAGIPVTIIETSQDALDKGIAHIAGIYDSSVKRGSLTPAKRDERIGLITGKIGIEAAADADVIIEAVFEDIQVKKDLFAQLDRIAKPGAILATNTSYLNINDIASVTKRPQDVLGLHFFSPANVMRLLEIVRIKDTAPGVLATALKLGKALGKLSVTVGVCFGFVGNRILAARSAAADRLLLQGALPFEIDAAITGFGFRMGHFAMGDLAGLDIGWRIRKAFTPDAAPTTADQLAEMGRFGQKTGRGFYLYPEGARTGVRDPEVEQMIIDASAKANVTRRAFTGQELIERLFYPMVNEGARILEEHIATRASDIDMVWINGYGWPAWTGGPMYWADTVGLDKIVAALDAQAAETGDDKLKPSALLRQLASAGRTFKSLDEGDI